MERLKAIVGRWSGAGVNHEKQPFRAEAEVRETLQGQAFHLQLTARGEDGTLYHEEETMFLVGPMFKPVSAYIFSITGPIVILAECGPEGLHAEGENLIQFATEELDRKDIFRQRITLKSAGEGRWVYAIEWGVPGGDFGPRSSVVFNKVAKG